MPLSTEDNLRLNVMLANKLDAVRIDEGRMIVYGLSADNEAQIQLNPNCRDEQYIKQVRELLSGHVLGSPGGYPVYLKRWTRMGQMKDDSLADLLKLGEPEAVMAVVCASGITNELARLAWWAAPEAEHARRMLESQQVVNGSMGKMLADFLVEFLPFEEDPYAIVRSVRLVLQGDLISQETRQKLWDKGNKKNVFRIGFLVADPDKLPVQLPPRADSEQVADTLQQLSDSGNDLAGQIQRVLSGAGQGFIQTCESILKKPANQEVVCALFNAIGLYFSNRSVIDLEQQAESTGQAEQDVQQLINAAKLQVEATDEAAAVMAQCPQLASEICAIYALAGVTDAIATPVFARTDAIGTVMRKKLEPVTEHLFSQFSTLQGKSD